MLNAARSLILAAGLACLPAAGAAQPVTMDRLWPNQDGRSWTYLQNYQSAGANPQVIDNQIRLLFEGPTTAPNAIECQYLRHELLSGPATPHLIAGEPVGPFLDQLWMSRPDLRARIQNARSDAVCPTHAPLGAYSVLLNGEFAWRRSADDVSAWRCNLADTRSWQWLHSNLSLGSYFAILLVPDLASDVILFGTVVASEPAHVPAGYYPSCRVMEYVVYYGDTQCTDEDGNPTGMRRAETRGWIRFAPDEGPVQSFEEFTPAAFLSGTCEGFVLGAPLSRTTLHLASPSVPVRPATWGSLKVRYR